MNAGRVFAVAGRLARQLRRDPRALALILFAPLLIMTLLAALLKTETEMPTIAIHAVGPASLFYRGPRARTRIARRPGRRLPRGPTR
ncbi:MAG: hypothetical protein M5R36_00795 [Deltaproteobacteria bacterium]|nr:hypothetical protein [Deltaproteobacteria bacterium]